MNATVQPPAAPEAAAFNVATAALNGWRGRCLAYLASAEAAVSEALIGFAERDPTTPLPHLVGQRYDALATILAARGDTDALGALRALRAHDSLRTALAHGVAKVTLDRNGEWLAVFTVIAFRSRRTERTILVIEEEQAARIAQQLGRERQRLIARLRSLTPPASPAA